jgi:hypothetical protein
MEISEGNQVPLVLVTQPFDTTIFSAPLSDAALNCDSNLGAGPDLRRISSPAPANVR